MSDHPNERRFENAAALLQFLKEHVDDIEDVLIPVQESVQIVSRERPPEVLNGVGAIIRICTGERICISCDDAAGLINDGILQRMKIKCAVAAPRRVD